MKTKLVGFILKSDLTRYLKTPIIAGMPEHTPITLDIWKDGDDLRDSAGGQHIIQVSIILKKEVKLTKK